MERIVFLDRKTCRTAIRPPRFPHQWQEYDLTPPGDIVPRLRDATIAITNKVPLRAPDLKLLPMLRYIGVAATGVDVVDLEYCHEKGITVANVPHYTQHAVPELVFLMILALRRNIFSYRQAMDAGLWPKSSMFSLLDFPMHTLGGSVLGIIGYGELGQRVEKIGKAFGMEVFIAERKHADRREGRYPFEEVLKRSDVVTLHAPLTPATRQLIGAPELAMMKPNALLINTARGGLLDERALAQALRTRLIAGAGLDVLSQEPPPADHPLIGLNLPNLLITPHIGWGTEEAVAQMAEQLIQNMELFVAGSPKNVVT
jgi:glycerate dehydrogenase